jgi:bis(5'-nucleosidyl)-tetraphosphatase
MAQQERSAGIIVFRLSDQQPPARLYLLLDYGRHWDYAKGHVHKGESDESAALRELAEETGIVDVAIMPGFREQITYFFRSRNRRTVRKTVVFFLGQTTTKTVSLSHEHVGYAFLPYEQAIAQVTYPTARSVLEKAEAFLRDRKPI